MANSPLSLLQLSADAFVKAGYSLSNIGIPTLTAHIQRQKFLNFAKNYGDFVKIPIANIVFDANYDIDLVESLILGMADQSVILDPYLLSRQEIGDTRYAAEIDQAVEVIMQRRDPRLRESFMHLMAMRSAFVIRMR
uniref:SIR2_2 domain-containing protein n=1 Tax=Steinernema glaseri TaxID=37863 RepID=A0A1I7ZGL0_9BILA